MFPKESDHLQTKSTPWNNLVQFLFEPYPTVTEIGTRREAQFTSILTFLFALLSLVGAISTFGVNGVSRNFFVVCGLALVSTIAYIITRTRFYKIGSYLLVWALVAIAFSAGDPTRLTSFIYANLILAFLIASITFSFRYMLFFVILNNLAISLIPLVYPGFTNVGALLGMFVPFGVLTIAVMRHRENIEKDRLIELKQSNQELTLLKDELEQRVDDRTMKLEQHAKQLQVVAEVARTAASFQDLDRLLTGSTRLISESFGFYHVGIFLLDEEGQYVTLRAANSEGGQRMLARSHTLPVDLNSAVGYTAKTQTPRIVLDSDTDAVYFNNPDLPETHSEMAVPLKVGMRLIGVLDVQSTEKDAFSEDDIAIISTLGDQLAVAMDNTRLLIETRRALVTAEQTYQRYFNQSWAQYTHHLSHLGYQYQDGKIVPVSEETDANQTDDEKSSKISIPLMVRGQIIGTLDVEPTNERQALVPGELSVLEAAAERAALALESARLLEDAQRRAAKEQAIGAASSKINAAINLDNILKTTLQEMGRILPGAEISIQIENN